MPLAKRELELYRNTNYAGALLELSNARDNLTGTSHANSVSSIKVLDGRTWQACDFPNYMGWCYRFKGWNADLGALGLGFDDRITSLRPLTDREVNERGLILYEGSGRAGVARRFTQSASHLGRLGIDNQASSAWVLDGTWELCREPGFESCTRVSGTVDSLPAGLVDSVSSVRRID